MAQLAPTPAVLCEIMRNDGRSRSLKVAAFDNDRKFVPVCLWDFLLANNSNLYHISHYFSVIAAYWSNYRF